MARAITPEWSPDIGWSRSPGVPTSVEVASEYRYRQSVVRCPNTLVVTISQSGETADTLAALRGSKDRALLSRLNRKRTGEFVGAREQIWC